MTDATMTPEQIAALANQLRVLLQGSTCGPAHATDVCVIVLADFALDDANDNPHEAAATLLRTVKALAAEIRTGRIDVKRGLDS